GLCLGHDPTKTSVADVTKVEISPSGELHYGWAVSDHEYLLSMAPVTPLLDPAVQSELHGIAASSPDDSRILRIFAAYLVREDSRYCKVPPSSFFDNQRLVAQPLERIAARKPA